MSEAATAVAAATAFVPVQVIVAGRAYTYKAPIASFDTAPDLSVRDHVVVEFGTKGFVVGVVESINEVPLDPAAKFEYKWIVDRVELSRYNLLKAAAPAVDPLAKFR